MEQHARQWELAVGQAVLTHDTIDDVTRIAHHDVAVGLTDHINALRQFHEVNVNEVDGVNLAQVLFKEEEVEREAQCEVNTCRQAGIPSEVRHLFGTGVGIGTDVRLGIDGGTEYIVDANLDLRPGVGLRLGMRLGLDLRLHEFPVLLELIDGCHADGLVPLQTGLQVGTGLDTASDADFAIGTGLGSGHEVARDVNPYRYGTYHKLHAVGEDVFLQHLFRTPLHASREGILQDELRVEVAFEVGLEVDEVAKADLLPRHVAEVEVEDAFQADIEGTRLPRQSTANLGTAVVIVVFKDIELFRHLRAAHGLLSVVDLGKGFAVGTELDGVSLTPARRANAGAFAGSSL